MEEVFEAEDTVCCRICRLPASDDNPLFSPCKCSGSIKHVHQECLISWLNHSGHKHCELCRHRFRFRPVYAPNAPSRLPWTELVWGLAARSGTGLALAARVLAVIATWLFVVPLLTCWMWRSAFLTSFSQGVNELVRRFQPVLVLADCIQGSLISSALILMVLLATYTADQIQAYWQILQPAVEEADQPEAPEPPLDGAAEGEVDPAAAGPWPAADADGEDSDVDPERRDLNLTVWRGPVHDSDGEDADDEGQGPAGSGHDRRQQGARVRAAADEQAAEQPRAPARRIRRARVREAPRPAAEAAPANPEQQIERDQFAFNELIGLEGPFHVLLENAGTVLFTIWAFMTAALWIPFMLGRVVVPGIVSWREALSASGAWTVAGPLLASLLGAQPPSGSTERNETAAAVATGNATAGGTEPWEGLASRIALLPLVQRLAGELEAHLGGPGLDDWVCLAIGYSVLLLLATLAFWSLVVWKLLWAPHVREGLRGHTDILRTAFADLGHQTRVHLGYAAVMIKVSVVLTLELTLLPALHGCWVDLCLLPLFGSSWGERAAWLQASPVSFLVVHWALGMGFLMAVASFLSVVRQQLRPGALPFFRDPYDGDDEPMRALMTLGLGQQLEREAYAMACLACLTVLLLHIPLRLTRLAAPGVFPLRFGIASPFAEAPTDLLLFHFLLPLTLPRLRVRHLMVRVVRRWLSAVSRCLGLDDYLMPEGGPGGRLGDQQAPDIIPHGFPGEPAAEDQAAATWRAEVDAARQRSGRLLTLLALMVFSLVAFNTALFNVPLLTGRFMFRALRLPGQHDLYNALCGAYALWGLAILGLQLKRIADLRSASAAAQQLARWGKLALRVGAMTILGLGVLPLLVGLFLELSVLPVRLQYGETPSYFVYQDWAVGLLFLRLFARCVLGWPRLEGGGGARRPEREAASGFEARLRMPLRRLRADLRRLRREGFSRVSFRDAFASVLWPLTAFWGVAVSLPLVISRGLAPHLPFVTDRMLHALFTYAWAAELGLFLLFVCAVKLASALDRLGSRLRDQRYLLHRELLNASD